MLGTVVDTSKRLLASRASGPLRRPSRAGDGRRWRHRARHRRAAHERRRPRRQCRRRRGCRTRGRAGRWRCGATSPTRPRARRRWRRPSSELGGLHVLANIAGVGSFASTRELALDDWNRTLAVNLTGTFLMSQAALDPLLETGGAIVNMASVSGLRALPYNAAYTASKGGVVMLTKAMAVEFGRAGLRVNCVCPSSVDTDFLRGFEYPTDADPSLFALRGVDHPAGGDSGRDRRRGRVPRVGRSGDGHRRGVDRRRWRYGVNPRSTFFVRTNSSMPARPPSRPKPLCFHAAERRGGTEHRNRVHGDAADVERARQPVCARERRACTRRRRGRTACRSRAQRLRPRRGSGGSRARGRRSRCGRGRSPGRRRRTPSARCSSPSRARRRGGSRR